MALDLLSNESFPADGLRCGGAQLLPVFGTSHKCNLRKDFDMMFDAPVIWLSVVIVRSCTNWTRTLRFLGQLQLARVEKVCQQRSKFKVNSNDEAEAKTGDLTRIEILAFARRVNECIQRIHFVGQYNK